MHASPPPAPAPINQIALPAHTPHRTLTLDEFLIQLQRRTEGGDRAGSQMMGLGNQGYLLCARIGAGGAAQICRRDAGAGATEQPGGGGGGE